MCTKIIKKEEKTAALHNLGCKVNAYESDAMRRMLEEDGYRIVPFSQTADVYVINTCSVTNTADHKSRQMIARTRKQNPDAVVIAAGCYVQVADEEQRDRLDADIIIGNNKKTELIVLLHRFLDEKENQTQTRRERIEDIIDINAASNLYEELKAAHAAEHTRAFLKIQDGCNQFCSYCVIPYARGRARSRQPEDILREAQQLAKDGYREIVLTGIHISSYGKDRGDDLMDLIRSLHAIDGICRIRLGSLEPTLITEDFAGNLHRLHKVCPHFHLSLQSGSDTVLKRMNRKYTTEQYRESCAVLRSFYENPAITTDIIVGFPQETEREFEETLQFAEEIGFADIHVFAYSRRDRTVAARMDGQISEAEKKKRSRVLMDLAASLRESYVQSYRGRRLSVLFEQDEKTERGYLCEGYSPEYIRVRRWSAEPLRNQMIEVEFFEDLY